MAAVSYKSNWTMYFSSIFMLILVWVCFNFYGLKVSKGYYKFNEGWTVTVNGTRHEEVKLSDFSFGTVPCGTELLYEAIIPEELGNNYTMQPLSFLSTVEAFVDGEQIYSYGIENAKNGKFVGSGYFFIDLPRDCGGKKLTLRFITHEPDAMTTIPPIECGPTNKIQAIYFRANATNLALSTFLVMTGFFVMAFSIFYIFTNPTFLRFIILGAFSFVLGIWSMCSSKLIQLISTDYEISTSLEYFSLYFAAIPFGLLIFFASNQKQRWRKITIITVLSMFSVFVLTCIFLHIAGILSIPRTLAPFHTFGAIFVITTLAAGFAKTKATTASQKYIHWALFVFSLSLLFDLLRYNINKYIFPTEEVLIASFIPPGTALFVILVAVSYISQVHEMSLSKKEKEILTRLAYTDSMTGFYNRTKYNQDIANLESYDDEFAIANFDVNGLKYVNDLHGHEAGDKLIQEFAHALKEVYGNYADCYRMGGDEFLMIAKSYYIFKFENLMPKFEELLAKKSKENDFEISASYGIAFKSEEKDPKKAYSLADERMYQMKLLEKKSRRFNG